MTQFIAIFILAGILASCTVPADSDPVTQGISGTVIDAENGSAIPNAVIETDPPSSTLTSDEAGAFEITDVSPGHYTVRVRAVGYELFETQVWVREGLPSRSDMMLVRYVAPPQLEDSSGTPYFPSAPAFSSNSWDWPSPSSSSVATTVSGARWKILAPIGGGSEDLNEVSAIAGAKAWITSDSSLFRCSGATCQKDASMPTIKRIIGMSLLNTSAGFVLGISQKATYGALSLAIWNGATWATSLVTSYATNCDGGKGLSVYSATDIWAHCYDEAWHWDGSLWQKYVLPSSIARIRQTRGGNSYALLGTGDVCSYNEGLWDCPAFTFSLTYHDGSWDFATDSTGTQFIATNYFGTLSGTPNSITEKEYTLDGYSNTLRGNSVDQSQGHGIIVFSNGYAYHSTNEPSWVRIQTPATQTLNSIDMVSPTDAWAVGDYGTVIRWTP
jgi:hypothetical protein